MNEKRKKMVPELVSVDYVRKRLEEIAASIKGGAKAESFSAETDRLLGTELPDRDREVEGTWEERRRVAEEL